LSATKLTHHSVVKQPIILITAFISHLSYNQPTWFHGMVCIVITNVFM